MVAANSAHRRRACRAWLWLFLFLRSYIVASVVMACTLIHEGPAARSFAGPFLLLYRAVDSCCRTDHVISKDLLHQMTSAVHPDGCSGRARQCWRACAMVGGHGAYMLTVQALTARRRVGKTGACYRRRMHRRCACAQQQQQHGVAPAGGRDGGVDKAQRAGAPAGIDVFWCCWA